MVLGTAVVLTHYARVMRAAWPLSGVAVAGLLLLPVFGVVVNGARRWYRLPGGFAVQPSEFAKLGLIIALASYLRFRHKVKATEGLVVPVLITLLPAALILKQPDLGSSMVLWPVLLIGALALVLGYWAMHDYQRTRVDVWWQHFGWQPEIEPGPDPGARDAHDRMRDLLRTSAYQPWHTLIAIGSGGWTGFGIGNGPQNVHDFLPYRESDYIFAVVAEETGFAGALLILGLELALALRILHIAARSRERFGRLLAVGVAAYLAAQSLLHVAVCAWAIPATGLPMPLLSNGGSSTLAALLGVALAVSVSARREPVLAADGFV